MGLVALKLAGVTEADRTAARQEALKLFSTPGVTVADGAEFPPRWALHLLVFAPAGGMPCNRCEGVSEASVTLH